MADSRREANIGIAMARKMSRKLDLEWHDKAACHGMDTSLFFSPDSADYSNAIAFKREVKERERKAKAVCATCPVRAACLRDNFDEEYGVFGGYTPAERSRIREQSPDAGDLPPEVDDPNYVPPGGRGGHNYIPGFDERVMELYREGKGAHSISLELGISKGKARRIIDASGEKRSPEEAAELHAAVSGRKPAPELEGIRKEIRKLLTQGRTATEIANMGYPRHHCFAEQKKLREANHLEPTWAANPEEIHLMRLNGASWDEVAEKIGVKKSTLERRYRYWCEKTGTAKAEVAPPSQEKDCDFELIKTLRDEQQMTWPDIRRRLGETVQPDVIAVRYRRWQKRHAHNA